MAFSEMSDRLYRVERLCYRVLDRVVIKAVGLVLESSRLSMIQHFACICSVIHP